MRAKTTGSSREPNLIAIGTQFERVDMNDRHPMSINELDLVGEGDVRTFLYGTLSDETWGPTSALDYPFGRTQHAGPPRNH
jgi:hypothetical protein